MFSFIGGVFKYTGLVLLILILSHVIEVKGVSVSNHVLHFMNGASLLNPKAQADKVTAEFSKTMQTRVNALNQINKVIETSQHKKIPLEKSSCSGQ